MKFIIRSIGFRDANHWRYSEDAMAKIEPERIAIPDLQKKMESGGKITIIDVRTPKEILESGAVPGAFHVPSEEIEKKIGDFPKGGDLVFYCGGGGRASRAAQKLWNTGRRNLYYFGLRDWKRRDLPTVKSSKPL